MTDRQSFVLSQLDRVLALVPRAEGKVATILPVAIAMLAVIAAKAPVEDSCSWRAATAIASAVCLSVCLWRVYETMFPQLFGPRRSLIFFGEIAKLSEQAYIEQLSKVSEPEVIEDVASQIWRNSEILSLKFAKAKSSFHWLAFAIPPWLTFLVLEALKEGKIPVLGG